MSRGSGWPGFQLTDALVYFRATIDVFTVVFSRQNTIIIVQKIDFTHCSFRFKRIGLISCKNWLFLYSFPCKRLYFRAKWTCFIVVFLTKELVHFRAKTDFFTVVFFVKDSPISCKNGLFTVAFLFKTLGSFSCQNWLFYYSFPYKRQFIFMSNWLFFHWTFRCKFLSLRRFHCSFPWKALFVQQSTFSLRFFRAKIDSFTVAFFARLSLFSCKNWLFHHSFPWKRLISFSNKNWLFHCSFHAINLIHFCTLRVRFIYFNSLRNIINWNWFVIFDLYHCQSCLI